MASSLKRRLVGMLASQALVVLLAAVGISSATGIFRQQALMREQLNGLARVVSANAVAAVEFGDPVAAAGTLGTLAERSEVVGARIDLRDGTPFAQFPLTQVDGVFASEASKMFDDSAVVFARKVRVEVPIEGVGRGSHDGEIIGKMTVVADLSGMWASIRRDLTVTVLSCVALFLLAVAVALRMQRRITGPVTALAGAAKSVAESECYDVRISRESDDEVGELVTCFNEMLARIRERDSRLTEHKAALEDTVAKRTAQLQVALEEAQAASRAKSEFLATMSHEIRTPMNGVLGMADLMRSTRLDDTQKHYAEAIVQSGRHLLGILNDILDFSKIESGKMTLESVPFDLHEVLEECLAMFAHPAATKGLELVSQFSPAAGEVSVIGDPFRLRQVVMNLLSNAVKFTDDGVVMVRVFVYCRRAGQVSFRIEVADTGIGIAQEAMERVFQHFTQADGSTTRRFGGTGLGLAICRRLVTLMGGSIALESEPGAGTTFIVDLTLPEGEAVRTAEEPDLSLVGRKVLVVDDNGINREILRQQIESWGMTVVDSSDARDAMAQLERMGTEEDRFDLCVLDMCMPDVSGLELARQIRACRRFDGLKLVMLTSVAEALDAATLRSAGISRCVSKPVRRSDLLRIVVSAMGDQKEAPVQERSSVSVGEPLRGWKVLLAEDNETNQLVAMGMLGQLGCSVAVVQNGQEALERLARESFDVVLMDCQMPVMDGYEATRAIRRFEGDGGSRLPIVALTANAMPGDRKQCVEAGMDDYLAKPYTREQLRLVLSKWLPEPIREPEVVDLGVEQFGGGSGDASEGEEELVSSESLRELRELDPTGALNLVERMLQTFVSGTSERIVELRDAVSARDAEAISRCSHWLKSSATNLGAHRLAEAFREIEEQGRLGTVDGVEARWARAQEYHAKVIAEVQRLLAQRS